MWPTCTTEPISLLDSDGKPLEEIKHDLTEDDLRRMYHLLLLTRKVDERAWTLVRQGKAYFYAPSSGQEAAQIGSACCLTKEDWVFPAHRDLGVVLAKGLTPEDIFNQLMAKSGDVSDGRQMPNHFGRRELRIVTPSSVVGNQIPQAVGTGLASKFRKEKSVSMVYFGEGGASQGDYHVALNFAGVFKTPSIFICENNQFAISVPVKQQASAESIAAEACGYGFNGFRVDGNDVMAMYAVTKDAVDHARKGGGPTLIEALTYRYGPHSSSDDETRYRSQEQVDEWKKKKDPIKRFRGYLKHIGLWNKKWDDEVQSQIDSDVEAAVQRVLSSDDPAPEALFKDVYAEMPWHLVKEQEEFKSYLKKE